MSSIFSGNPWVPNLSNTMECPWNFHGFDSVFHEIAMVCKPKYDIPVASKNLGNFMRAK